MVDTPLSHKLRSRSASTKSRKSNVERQRIIGTLEFREISVHGAGKPGYTKAASPVLGLSAGVGS